MHNETPDPFITTLEKHNIVVATQMIEALRR